MFLAPLSEIYGRQPIYLTGTFLFSILQIPAALSPTFAGVAVTRFLTGCFAGLPVSNVGASAADLYPTSGTAWAVMLFSFTSQALGPDLGVRTPSLFSSNRADILLANLRRRNIRFNRKSEMALLEHADIRNADFHLGSDFRRNSP